MTENTTIVYTVFTPGHEDQAIANVWLMFHNGALYGYSTEDLTPAEEEAAVGATSAFLAGMQGDCEGVLGSLGTLSVEKYVGSQQVE